MTTVGNGADAKRLAQALVGERLAACVNIVDTVRSVYRWLGEVHDEAEVLLIVKTVDARLDALQTRLLELHPYELPELMVLDPVAVSERYLSWLEEETLPRA